MLNFGEDEAVGLLFVRISCLLLVILLRDIL